MTAFFDNREKHAQDSIESALVLEKDTDMIVMRLAGDREFPETYRKKIMSLRPIFGLETFDGKKWVLNEKNVTIYHGMNMSRYLSEMHRLWHEIGMARIETRFGIISDDPLQSSMMRDEYDKKIRA